MRASLGELGVNPGQVAPGGFSCRVHGTQCPADTQMSNTICGPDILFSTNSFRSVSHQFFFVRIETIFLKLYIFKRLKPRLKLVVMCRKIR